MGEEKIETICKSIFKDGTCETSKTVVTDVWISLIRQMEETAYGKYF